MRPALVQSLENPERLRAFDAREDATLVSCWLGGKPADEIARRLGVTLGDIGRNRHALGLPDRDHRLRTIAPAA